MLDTIDMINKVLAQRKVIMEKIKEEFNDAINDLFKESKTNIIMGQIIRHEGEIGVYIDDDGYSGFYSLIYTPSCEVNEFTDDVDYKEVFSEEIEVVKSLSDITPNEFELIKSYPYKLKFGYSHTLVYFDSYVK